MNRTTYRHKRVMAGTPMRECEVLLYQPLCRQALYHVAVQETQTAVYRLVRQYHTWAVALENFNDLVRHPPIDLGYPTC